MNRNGGAPPRWSRVCYRQKYETSIPYIPTSEVNNGELEVVQESLHLKLYTIIHTTKNSIHHTSWQIRYKNAMNGLGRCSPTYNHHRWSKKPCPAPRWLHMELQSPSSQHGFSFEPPATLKGLQNAVVRQHQISRNPRQEEVSRLHRGNLEVCSLTQETVAIADILKVWEPMEFKRPAASPFPNWNVHETKPRPYRPFRHGAYHITMGLRNMNWDEWIGNLMVL